MSDSSKVDYDGIADELALKLVFNVLTEEQKNELKKVIKNLKPEDLSSVDGSLPHKDLSIIFKKVSDILDNL